MGKFPVPCLICGGLTLGGNLCAVHKKEKEKQHDLRRAAVKKATGQYSGSYRARAKKVRESTYVCYLCNQGARPNDPWEADHVIAADPNSPLMGAHRSCNAKRGNKPLT